MMGDARDIARMLGEKANPKVPTRVRATVTKVEPSRTWVRINGSSGETPCASTSASVKPGDAVSVLITGNRATIEGNYTSPATDDSKAIEAIKTGSSAQQTADMAHELATNAIADAQATRDAAERAEADATRAAVAAESSEASARASAASAASSASSAALSKEAADRAIVEAEKATAAAGEAYRKAEEAGDEAIRANSYAVGALNGLSAVQDVMGVIEWARDNGEFVAATGDFDPTATYFVADPEGNYTDGTNRYSVVAEPDADSFAAGDYYVLDVSEAMADFVNSHLAVADEGLYVSQQLSRNEDGTIDFCGNSYVLITPTGFEVYDSFGRLVTKYGAEMVMGNGATKTTINSQYLELNWTHDVMTDDGLVTVTDNVFSVGVKEEGDTPSLSFMNGSVFFGRDGRTIICNGRFEMQPNGDAELDNGEIKMSIEGREFRVRRYQEVRSGDVIQEVEERLLDVGLDADGKRYLTFAKGGRSQNGSTPEAVTALFSVDDDGTPTFANVPGARGNLSVPGVASDGEFWGLTRPNGTDDIYLRAPRYGLIPWRSTDKHAAAGTTNQCYLGTSAWPWYAVYATNHYGTWSGNTITVAKGGTGSTTAAGARANIAVPGYVEASSHWRITEPDGTYDKWMRVPTPGIIPAEADTTNKTGKGSLGSGSWYFASAYVVNYYGNWAGNKIPISKGGTNGTTASEARQNLAVPMIGSDGSYWGLGNYANQTGWLRSPSSGFLPFKSGGSGGSLGTTSWPWYELWAKYGHFKDDLTVSDGYTYKIVMAGGPSYAWFDMRSTSGTMVNNLVLFPDKHAETQGGALVTSGWDANNIREIHRADNYLHITTRSYGAKGVSWWDSDARMKENVEQAEASALDAIRSIDHRSFDMKDGGRHYKIGYIAQELEEIDPNFVLKVPESREIDGEWVFTGDHKYQVDERGLIPYLSKAIQELADKVETLEARVAELEGDI